MFWGQVPVPSPGLDESFSSPRGILAAQLLSSSAEPPKRGCGCTQFGQEFL